MRAHPSLTKLALRANVIGASSSPAGLRALASALGAADTRVRSLDLSGNPLGCEGASLLAALVSSQPRLKRLDAACCTLTGSWGKLRDGVRALAAAVAGSSTLEQLDLSENAIGRSSESMDQWHIDQRNVPACPAVFLVEAIRQNRSLRSLDLHANHIVGDQEARLHEAWNGRPVDCPAGLRI